MHKMCAAQKKLESFASKDTALPFDQRGSINSNHDESSIFFIFLRVRPQHFFPSFFFTQKNIKYVCRICEIDVHMARWYCARFQSLALGFESHWSQFLMRNFHFNHDKSKPNLEGASNMCVEFAKQMFRWHDGSVLGFKAMPSGSTPTGRNF